MKQDTNYVVWNFCLWLRTLLNQLGKKFLVVCCLERGKDVWGKVSGNIYKPCFTCTFIEKGDRLVKLCLVECEEEIKNLQSWDDGIYAHMSVYSN